MDILWSYSGIVQMSDGNGKCAPGSNYVEHRDGVNLTAQFKDDIAKRLASKNLPTKHMSIRLAETISRRQRQLAFLQKSKRDREEASIHQGMHSSGPGKPILSQPLSLADPPGAMPSQFPPSTPADIRADVFASSPQQMRRLGPASVGCIDRSLKNFPPPPSINESTARQIVCPYCNILMDRDSFRGENWL